VQRLAGALDLDGQDQPHRLGSGSKNHSAAFSAMQPVTDRRLP
jgi:hypothetical protein